MHPLHQTIAPCEIEFFLIAAVAIARVAVIAVTENQRRQIVGKVSAQRDLPNNLSTLILRDRKSTRLNSSHTVISYAVFCLKKKKSGKARAGLGKLNICTVALATSVLTICVSSRWWRSRVGATAT